MRKVRESASESPGTRPPRRPAARTPEARENQMVSLAVDVAEEQLRNRTASSQVITHFLRLASPKEKLEKEILELQKDLMKAKTEAINSSRRVEELYINALNAMRSYSGETRQEEIDD